MAAILLFCVVFSVYELVHADDATFSTEDCNHVCVQVGCFATFRVIRRRGEMYIGHGCLCVCVPVSSDNNLEAE